MKDGGFEDAAVMRLETVMRAKRRRSNLSFTTKSENMVLCRNKKFLILMKIETSTISVAITKAEREKKDGSPALIKEESHKSKKYHDPIIKKEAEEGDNDSGNDNDNGDITDGPPDEEEGELVSDAIAKEYVYSSCLP